MAFPACAFAGGKIDSLEKLLPRASDTSRLSLLLQLGKEYNSVNLNKSLAYYQQALELSLSLPDSDGVKNAYRGLGLSNFLKSDYLEGIALEEKALSIRGKKNQPSKEADSYAIIGNCNFKLGKTEQALAMYHKALDIYESVSDVQRSSMVLNNIGSLYYEQNRNREALDYFLKAKKFKEKIKDKRGLASLNMNIATIYAVFDSIPASLKFYDDALAYYLETGDSLGIAEIYSGTGTDYLKLKEYDKALLYKNKALAIARAFGDRSLQGHLLNDIGDIYSHKGINAQAINYLDSGLAIALETKNAFFITQSYAALMKHYERIKDPRTSLKYHKLLAAMQDSMYNEKNVKLLSDMQSRYEAEKKQAQIDLLRKDADLQAIQVKNNNTLLLTLIPGLLLVVLIMIVLFGRNQIRKKATRQLEFRHELLSQQEKEITDSIRYSLSIQQSMLPSDEYISASLEEYFVLNRPKDIVSGDFYFFERSGSHLIFSAVDCTGHGVPGALLSFLGMDVLREAVRKRGLTRPSDILGFLDHEVSQRLKQSTEKDNVRDGMDLALCTLNPGTRELQFAGAFNPVYIISGGRLEEIKPDKYAIGSNPGGHADQYTNHVRQLKKGDCVYVFSDGYADQFGGPGGKKFKYKPLQQLLLNNCNRTMREQKQVLEISHLEWKGNLFQVDDILVIGIRV